MNFSLSGDNCLFILILLRRKKIIFIYLESNFGSNCLLLLIISRAACVPIIKQHWEKMAEIPQEHDFLTWVIKTCKKSETVC